MSSRDWKTQPTWYIDPVNGLDSNVGDTALTAIKTIAEWVKRINEQRVEIVMTINLVTAAAWPANDPWYLRLFVGSSGFLRFVGTRTTLFSGTLDSATAINRATQTPQSIGDSTLGAGGFGNGISNTSAFKKRIRLAVAGVDFGISWGVKDPATAKTIRTGRYILPTSAYPEASSFTLLSPAGTESYFVETLTELPQLTIDLVCDSVEPFAAGLLNQVRVSFEDIQLPPVVAGDVTFNYAKIRTIGSGSFVQFLGCGLQRVDITGSVAFQACTLAQVLITQGTATILSCCIQGRINCNQGSALLLDGDTIRDRSSTDVNASAGAGQMAAINGGSRCLIGFACAFDCLGEGFLVNPGGSVVSSAQFYSGDLLWGNANDIGIKVASGGLFSYATKPTITGATADTKIGGVNTAYAAVPAITAANNAAIVLTA